MNHISIVFWLIPPLSAITIQILTLPISGANGFITLPPLTLTSFKAMDVILKYAWFLKIGNVALYQERKVLIVSMFQYTQCIGGRQVKLKPISRSISSEWYTIFVSYNCIVWNKPARLCTCKYVLQCPNNASECKHRWNAVFCLIHFSVSQRLHSFKWFSYFKWRAWGYFMSEIKCWNVKIGCISCKWTSKRPEKNVTNDFR